MNSPAKIYHLQQLIAKIAISPHNAREKEEKGKKKEIRIRINTTYAYANNYFCAPMQKKKKPSPCSN